MNKVNWEERVLGMRAVEKRFITEKQLTECLNTIEFFEPETPLEEVFIAKGYLTKKQIQRLRDEVEGHISLDFDKGGSNGQTLFGDMAIGQCMITEDQLFEALDEQETYVVRGLRVQIGQILSKKSYMTVAQVKRLVESQKKKVLYCTKCEQTEVIHSYSSGQIYQCKVCSLDLIEAEVPEESGTLDDDLDDDDDDFGDDDDDLGTLDILEL